MQFFIKTIFLFFLICNSIPIIAKEIVSKNTITKIDQFIISQINQKKVVGCAVAIVDQGRIVFHGGWLKGFTNFLGFIPDLKVGIVILNTPEGRFAQEVAFTFFDLIKE